MTNHITFDTTSDIVADKCGVYTVPSGCTPHHPDETRLVFRNADFKFRIDQKDESLVKCAAGDGDMSQLRRLVERLFTPTGRASECGWI